MVLTLRTRERPKSMGRRRCGESDFQTAATEKITSTVSEPFNGSLEQAFCEHFTHRWSLLVQLFPNLIYFNELFPNLYDYGDVLHVLLLSL